MAFHKGRRVRFEMAATYAPALTLSGAGGSAITTANPGVLTHTAHGFANGDVGLFSNMVGMEELEGQAIRAANITANTLELEGIDTSDYTPFGATGTGSLAEVATWATLSQQTRFAVGGGEAATTDVTVLLDYKDKLEVGSLSAETLQGEMYADPKSVAVRTMRAYAKKSSTAVFRATYLNEPTLTQLVVLFAGVPSYPTFDQNVKEVARATFSITVKGDVLYL
ncbi:MAG: phage tail tube protein [Alphaproteobacteria bacterium]